MVERGADLAYGRTLPRLLRESGPGDVRAEAYFPIASPACSILEAATVRRVRDQLLAAELATPDEIDRHLGNLARGDLDLMLAHMITAWGQTLVLHDRPVVMQEDDPTHHPDPSSTSCEGTSVATSGGQSDTIVNPMAVVPQGILVRDGRRGASRRRIAGRTPPRIVTLSRASDG
jgi:hypothetical protein